MLDHKSDRPGFDDQAEDAMFRDVPADETTSQEGSGGGALGRFRAGVRAMPGSDRPHKPIWRRILVFLIKWFAILTAAFMALSALAVFVIGWTGPPPTFNMAQKAMSGVEVRKTWVPLKDVSANGFVFYSNTESRKGQQLAANGQAAAVFHWKSLRRQVRLSGRVESVTDAEADAYFATRAKDSQIGAWASDQSRPMKGRFELESRIATAAARYRHVVQACFNGRRIVVFSGGEAKDLDGIYNEARAIRDGGGNGSIIGRNTFQRPREDALKMLETMIRIYRGEA